MLIEMRRTAHCGWHHSLGWDSGFWVSQETQALLFSASFLQRYNVASHLKILLPCCSCLSSPPFSSPKLSWPESVCLLSCLSSCKPRALCMLDRCSTTKIHLHFALNVNIWNSFLENLILMAKCLVPAVVLVVNWKLSSPGITPKTFLLSCLGFISKGCNSV